MIKLIQWFLISIAVVVLTACGGSGGKGSGGNTSQVVKTNYEIKSDVVQYSTTDELKRVDNTTKFTAPISIGLSEGDIFIYENVAYKISMIAVDDTSDTITIFTKKPTLDETIESLEINGSIPFSAPKTSATNSFKLNAKVTNKKSNKKSAVTFECEVPNDSEEISGGFTFGVTCTAKSGDATIVIESTETVKGGVDVDYDKNRDDADNKIGFDVNIHVVSTLSSDYKVEIDNDQDPKKLFPTTRLVLGTTPITVSVDYFFLAGASFDGSASYTRTDDYNYKRMYDFNYKVIETEQNATSTNDLEASVTIGAHVGLRPMVSIGVFYIDLAGLYVDAKVKEAITVSGKLPDETSQTCVTSKLDFTLQAGYKLIGGEYKLLGSEYSKNLRTDVTEGCAPSYQYYFFPPRYSCPARPYSPVSKKSNKTINSSSSTISYTIADTSDDSISSELSNGESYERIIQIDKTGIGDKIISKVTWEVVDGDMDLKIESLESDGSVIMLSAMDEEGNDATLKATIYASDGTTISQETNVARNSKPVAVPKVYVSGNDLVLDASSSYDPDGNQIIVYGWLFVDTGKRIINKSPINKVPLSNLPNTINLKMAVASKNKPIEVSEIESISFEIPDINASLNDLIVGKTFYQHCKDNSGDLIATITFQEDGNITFVGNGESKTIPYRIDRNIFYTINDGVEEAHTLSENTDTYIRFNDGDGYTSTLYFTSESAQAAPADDCGGNDEIDANDITSGNVVFKDSNENSISIPNDAWIRIVPEENQKDTEGWNGLRCKIQSDGSFGNNDCYTDGDYNKMKNLFGSSNSFQIVVFKNHIEPNEHHWDCREDVYKYVGDGKSSMWQNIEVLPENYQDSSGETCNED